MPLITESGRHSLPSSIDTAVQSGNDRPMSLRRTPHQREVASHRSHEEALLRVLYEQHAQPLLVFVLRTR
jgi:hypothetical protein